MARARISACQWALPVLTVKAEGMARISAPAFGQCAIELGEAQVIANGDAEFAPGQIGDDGGIAGPIVLAFTIVFAAGQGDVEHMDFVVAGDEAPLGSISRARLASLSGATATPMEPMWSQILSSRASARKCAMAGLPSSGRGIDEEFGPVHFHQGRDFGRLDVDRALAGGVADHGGDVGEIVFDRARGRHLDQGGFEFWCGGGCRVWSWSSFFGGLWVAAYGALQAWSSWSSSPEDSSAKRSSQPPTCVSPIQICGTVVRPPDCWRSVSRKSDLPPHRFR